MKLWWLVLALCLCSAPVYAESDCLDGVDNDGDTLIDCLDEGCLDGDGDGGIALVCGGEDCDDEDPAVGPHVAEVACNGIDDDCLDGDRDDWDGDGRICEAQGGDDCDDFDARVAPGAFELCDGRDNDCDCSSDTNGDGIVCGPGDLQVDEDDDPDGDGADWCGGDCDPEDGSIGPAAVELCDGRDSDCDGVLPLDEVDRDGDGVLDCADCDDTDAEVFPGRAEDCADARDLDCDGATGEDDADGDGFRPCDGDCADDDPARFPGAGEVCNGLDDDCDLSVDEDFDRDGDGWAGCDGIPVETQDCDDDDIEVHPGALELCEGAGLGRDEDCDGAVDENEDRDLDGRTTCEGDCDDYSPFVGDGALELCNRVDDDCDGLVDEGFDGDGDGWSVCDGDCNDGNAEIGPQAVESCDLIDNNCDGSTDEGLDGDGDGVCDELDCAPDDATISPLATELCNDRDDTCDGRVDEDFDQDVDGWTTCQGDCDDTEATASPEQSERCADTIDNDCDGLIDTQDEECPGLGQRDAAWGCQQGPHRSASGAWWGLALLALLGSGRRGEGSPATGPARSGGSTGLGLLGLIALLALGPAPAKAQEPAPLVLYQGAGDGADEDLQIRLALRSRGLEAESAEVRRLSTHLLDRARWLVALAGEPALPCRAEASGDVYAALDAALQATQELRNADAQRLLSDAWEGLPCSPDPVDRRTLAELSFYLGYNRALLDDGSGAVAAFLRALALDPALRWDDALSPVARDLFERVRAYEIRASEGSLEALPGGQGVAQVGSWLDRGAAAPAARLRLELAPGELVACWVDGVGRASQAAEIELRPGEHLVQWALPEGGFGGMMVRLQPGEEASLLGPAGQAAALTRASDAAERERARAVLGEVEREQVVVLALAGAESAAEAPAVVFDQQTGNTEPLPTAREREAARLASRRGQPFRPDRVRLAGAFSARYVHPYSYLGGTVALSYRPGVAPFQLDVGIGLGRSLPDEEVAAATLPWLRVGAGWIMADRLARPTLVLSFLLSPDSLTAVSPGAELALQLDLLPSGAGPVVVRLRPSVGVAGYRTLAVDGVSAGPLRAVPMAGIEVGLGARFVRAPSTAPPEE